MEDGREVISCLWEMALLLWGSRYSQLSKVPPRPPFPLPPPSPLSPSLPHSPPPPLISHCVLQSRFSWKIWKSIMRFLTSINMYIHRWKFFNRRSCCKMSYTFKMTRFGSARLILDFDPELFLWCNKLCRTRKSNWSLSSQVWSGLSIVDVWLMLGHLLMIVLNLSSVKEKMPIIYSIPSTEHELYI